MRNRNLLLMTLLMLVVFAAFVVYSLLNPSGRATLAGRPKQMVEEVQGLTNPGMVTQRNVAPAPTVTPRPRPTPAASPLPTPVPRTVVVPQPVEPTPASFEPTSMRVYTSSAASAPEPTPLADYAPYGRLIKCHLIGTVDSSTINTPVHGAVDHDLVWDGKLIIPRGSEVHARAQIDKMRERIASEGVVTFVLHDPQDPGLGRELVVKGELLDREEDPNFRTFGITDESAGLRGMVIKTDKLAELKLFAATFISGIAEGLKSTTTDLFGNVVNDPNGRGAGGLPGYVINPAAQSAQNVLDAYAQQMLQSIERDGFFVRVPSGKQFYVYVEETIDLGKATIGGDAARERLAKQFLQERATQEQVTQPRTQRDLKENRANPYQGQIDQALEGLRQNEARLLDAQQRLQQQQQQPLPPSTAAVPR